MENPQTQNNFSLMRQFPTNSMPATPHVGQASRLPSVISALLATMIGFLLPTAHGEDSESEREKPVKSHVKIFNASKRSGVELWETGLDLEFRGKPLAADVRIGEGGLVRPIEFTSKDTVDVRRHVRYLKVKGQPPRKPAASLGAAFPEGSVTLLVVHGEIGPGGEQLEIDTIREFPVPDDAKRPSLARFMVWNFKQGNAIFLAIGDLPPFELPYRESREFFLQPAETEIFMIYKTPGQLDLRRQLAVFDFIANRNYTGIISPAAGDPDRPRLRISDSNGQWEGIATPSEESSAAE
jgi:hypothetical protein